MSTKIKSFPVTATSLTTQNKELETDQVVINMLRGFKTAALRKIHAVLRKLRIFNTLTEKLKK